MFIQTEATPNPATLKFLPGRAVLDTGTHGIRQPRRRGALAAGRAAVRRPGVTGVFYGSDFVTVTKDDGDWQHLKPAILGAIMEHYMSGAPLLADGTPARRGRGRGRRVLRRGRRRDRRDHQGADRDPGAPGGRQRRRRHHLPRLQGRHRLSGHEGRLLRLPVLDRDAEARHPEPAASISCPTWSKSGRCESEHESVSQRMANARRPLICLVATSPLR